MSLAPNRQEGAAAHAPARERTPIHLERAAERDLRVIDPARVALARGHVEDPQDPAALAPERDRQRDGRVLHPEPPANVALPEERHARFRCERAPAAQTLLELYGRLGNLDADLHGGSIGRADHRRAVRERDGGRESKGREDAEHGPIVRQAYLVRVNFASTPGADVAPRIY